MTFIEKFEEIKKKIALPRSKGGVPTAFAVEIDLTDEDCGGAFYVALADGVLSVEPYDYHDHTALVRICAEDLADLLSGAVSAFDLAVSGRAEVFGNFEHFAALADLKAAPRRGGRPKKSETDAAEAAPRPKSAK
ncbi:MAG: hypothetical protein IJS44_03065 [Clostridia bacterium]|nr:hypothetical protein [Clostridia bacterium]